LGLEILFATHVLKKKDITSITVNILQNEMALGM